MSFFRSETGKLKWGNIATLSVALLIVVVAVAVACVYAPVEETEKVVYYPVFYNQTVNEVTNYNSYIVSTKDIPLERTTLIVLGVADYDE